MSQKNIDGNKADIKKAEEKIKALTAEYAQKQADAKATGKGKVDKIRSGQGKKVQDLEGEMNIKKVTQENAEKALARAQDEFKAAKEAHKLAFKEYEGALKDQSKESEAIEKNLSKELDNLLKEQKNAIKSFEKNIKTEEKAIAKAAQTP